MVKWFYGYYYKYLMDKKYICLADIDCYVRSYRLSNLVWNIVIGWNILASKTVGEQYVQAIDSISANVAEGFGRYFKKDRIKFYYYSMGSAKEAMDWTQKSYARKLLTQEQYNFIMGELKELPKEIHNLINYTNTKLKK